MLNNRSVFRFKSTRSYYEVLGIPHNATQEQIKTAFLELSKKVHPDQNPDASSHDKFVEINTAYMVLGKAASRRDYDMQMRYSSHPFFNDSYEGPRSYGPYEGPYRSRENNVHDIPYWKKDPFSDYGYEYEQMRREREWREKWFNGQTTPSDPEQHPYAIWVRLPIGLFYLAFIYLILWQYKNNPDRFRSRGAREREQLRKMEEASLGKKAAQKEELDSNERPYYVVETR